MQLLRQYLYLLFPLSLSGCVVDVTPLIYNSSPFSVTAQEEGNAQCNELYNNAKFTHLKGKMPVRPAEIPTRAMLSVATVPADNEVRAIQALEAAVRNCRQLRAAAGMPTSATEDIQAARVSRLRYGLYKGEIPYAVYNHGLVQVMRQSQDFMLAGETAGQRGKEIGQERQRQALMQAETQANLNKINSNITGYRNDFNSYKNDLNHFYDTIPSGTWFCKGYSCN
ncbi:MAG: hypothetical protein COB59_11720 [Rhodospirillaceae bacterium]|nr:MAG: hypothetical protein COB59_11720 [Rhodospirillaceae bacterium]